VRRVIVLVVGLGESSGKTTLTASLVSALRGLGLRASAFKPYAATRLWDNPRILAETASRRVVVTGDSLRLSEASGGVHPEVINPAALLVGVPDYAARGWRPAPLPGPDTLVLGVLGRLSRCDDGRVHTLHFINMDALRLLPQSLQDSVVDAAATLKPYPLRVGGEFVERVLSGEYDPVVASCLSRIMRDNKVVVVESNSDVPLPLAGLAPSIVLVVAPGAVGIIPGDRYLRSLEALGVVSGRPSSMVRVEDVVRLSGVVETLPLPFLEDPEDYYRRDDLDLIIEKIVALAES